MNGVLQLLTGCLKKSRKACDMVKILEKNHKVLKMSRIFLWFLGEHPVVTGIEPEFSLVGKAMQGKCPAMCYHSCPKCLEFLFLILSISKQLSQGVYVWLQ